MQKMPMTMKTLTNDGIDVWSSLSVPGKRFSTEICESAANTFLIARDTRGRYCFIVDLPSTARPNPSIASLNGVEVSVVAEELTRPMLLLQLNNNAQWPIFKLLCQEIIREGEQVHDLSILQSVLIETIERFCRFYRRRDEQLTPSKVRGLIGELLFLQRKVAPAVGWGAALDSWLGPMGTAQDFSFGSCVVEVKTNNPQSRDCVRISSLEQLSVTEGEGYLHVYSLRKCSVADNSVSVSLTQLLEDIRQDIRASGMLPETFDALLSFVCRPEILEDEKTLCQTRYIVEDEKSYCFTASSAFPRITRDMVQEGIACAQYEIRLSVCEKYECDINIKS